MPVRKIPISGSSLTGKRSRLGKLLSIGFESSLERDFITLTLFDSSVIDIEEQPVRISYIGDCGKKRSYTPDFLVTRRDESASLIEVKPQKFLTPDLETKFKAARQYALANEWRFEIWTEKEIRIPRLLNAEFLPPYINHPVISTNIEIIASYLNQNKATSVSQLISACGTNDDEQGQILSTLWHLIASKIVLTDFEQEITSDSIVWMTAKVKYGT